MENKEIQAFAGINNEYVPFGNFIIQKPDNKEVKEKTNFIGYDYMIKFNVPYKNRVTHPIKAGLLFKDVCEQVGLEAGNTNFINSEYMILGNPFTNNEDCRTVLSNLAQLAGGFAKIGRDNKVYIKTLKNISNLLTVKYVNAMTVKEFNLTMVKALSAGRDNADEKIDGNNYFTDFSKNEQWGELNSLVLRISGTEGENTTLQDNESITNKGLTELTIEDNYFLINQIEREKVITPIWNSLKGIKYLPFKTNYYGYPYLDCGDMIYIQDTKDIGYISYVFNHTFKFNGGFSGTLDTPAMTKTQTAYKNTFDLKTKFKNAERKIDKINGIIEDIIEEQTETSQKLTQHKQTIDAITNRVEQIEDVTNTVEGIKTIALGNCMEGELLELHIYGNNTVFDYLYPSDDLYPSDNLYPRGDSRIVVNDKIYELGITDVLRQNGEVRDEFVLLDGKAKVIRRINKDGTVKATETTEELGELKIPLQEGTNTITIKNYTARLKARFAIKNEYTEVFATRVEMNSSITQTANEINMEVRKKVDENEVISKINQSAEAVGINANKIELSANDILNLLSGNAINLGGKKITIKSDNFNVDEKGNMTCNKGTLKNVNIEGGDIKLYPTDNLKGIRIFRASSPDDTRYMTYVVNGAIGCNDGENNAGITPSSIGVGLSTMYSDHITTPILNQTSLESQKKNFEKLQNGLNIINNTEIYKYNLKSQNDEDKKHIGFVIGKDYKYSSEITAIDSEGKEVGVDTYSMISVAYKAIQELTEKNKLLEKRVEELEAK